MGTPLFDEVWRDLLSRRDATTQARLYTMSGTQGIDCSQWQGAVSWAPVAASGRSFAVIKASEGNGSSYPTVDAQYHGALNAGLVTGLYHFAQPTISPEANADAFAAQINRLGAIPGHLPPALDLEVGTGDLSGWAHAFVARLRAQTGCRRVTVYSSVSFLKDHIHETWMDDDILIWAADFSVPPGFPRYSSPRLAIHQYSQTGHVPGVNGNVDLNVALRPLDQIIEGGDVSPEEHRMLVDIHNKLPVIDWLYGQFAGLGADGHPAPFPTVVGWPTLPGGTNQKLSFLDYSRQMNCQIQALHGTVLSVLSAVTSSSGGQVSDADVAFIAQQVAAEFAAKLGAPGV